MAFMLDYREEEPTRNEIDQRPGLLLLEFGNGWCGHCQAATPAAKALLQKHPQIEHLRIADGRGKPLGRSFRVKLWPTFVLLRDGQNLGEAVRPNQQELDALAARI
jgi:thioredoxin 1